MGEKPEISPAGVYFVSLVLLAVTVGAAFLHLGVGNVIISLVVATLQMAFIAVYFMQLRFSSPLLGSLPVLRCFGSASCLRW